MLFRAFILIAIGLASTAPFSVQAEPNECIVFGTTQNGTPTATNKCNRTIWLSFCSTTGAAKCKETPTTVTPTRRYYDYGLDSILPEDTMWLIGVPANARYATSACFTPDMPYIIKFNGISSYTAWCAQGGASQERQDARHRAPTRAPAPTPANAPAYAPARSYAPEPPPEPVVPSSHSGFHCPVPGTCGIQ